MSQLEYLIAFVSIIVGLGLTDLARSLRELVRPGRPVLPLAWAAIVFLLVLQVWWQAFRFLRDEVLAHVAAFAPVLLGFLLLYLLCAFALPDPERATWRVVTSPEEESEAGGGDGDVLDLKAFYFSGAHRRWFFGTFIGLLGASQLFNVAKWGTQREVAITTARLVQNAGVNVGIIAVLTGLIVTDRRWVHGATTLLVTGVLVYTLLVGIPAIG
ncbi:hypothetical protein [Salinibacter grassmerensis]|uniref:hypothetical protein n=1 Tax=Salinibacter grassmerensis TaxID=3040353 RepID=UPI0021E86B0D|nr:hypothetical protein [Salinibacter grassmerensis]